MKRAIREVVVTMVHPAEARQATSFLESDFDEQNAFHVK
jgi:hypothetical protein